MINYNYFAQLRSEVRFTIFKMNSVEEFAEKCGLSRKTIYNFLDESKMPSTRTVAKICDGLGIDFKTFFGL